MTGWRLLAVACGFYVFGAASVLAPVALSDEPVEAKPDPFPTVRYIDCIGGAHAWVTSEGGIAVLPAGGSCP